MWTPRLQSSTKGDPTGFGCTRRPSQPGANRGDRRGSDESVGRKPTGNGKMPRARSIQAGEDIALSTQRRRKRATPSRQGFSEGMLRSTRATRNIRHGRRRKACWPGSMTYPDGPEDKGRVVTVKGPELRGWEAHRQEQGQRSHCASPS